MTSQITNKPSDAPEPTKLTHQAAERDFPFELRSFHQCWWRSLSRRFDIPFKDQDLLIHRKKVAKGLLRLKEIRISGWNMAWNQALTEERLLELQGLQQTNPWDYFQVRMKIDDDFPQSMERLSTLGYPGLIVPAPCQYSADLSQGLDTYLKGLSHNSRKSLKKKTRLAQPLEPTLVAVQDSSEVEPFIRDLIRYHIAYWDQKVGYSYLNNPMEKEFLYQWAWALYQSGHLVLDRLLMNDQIVNMSVGVRSDDTFYWLFTVNTGLWSEYAPGIVGLNLRLEACAQQNIQQFNMGSGDYFYKIQSANRTIACADVYVFNPKQVQGVLYQKWLQRKHRGNAQVLSAKSYST